MTNPVAPSASGEEHDLARILALLIDHRRSLVAIPFVTAVVTAIVVLLWPKSYTSQAQFVPSPSATDASALGATGVLGSIAASLHLTPTNAMTGSPQYFNALMVSQPLLEKVMWSRYRLSGPDSTETSLISVLDLTKYDSATAELYALKRLRDKWISQDVDPGTGIATLSVTSPDPLLSSEVAQRILDLLDQFNRSIENGSARARREFVGARLDDAAHRLKAVEDSLRTFRTKNRIIDNSPALELESARLQRQIDVENQVYLTLRQEYESARIDEVRDTPELTIIQSPAPPALHDPRHGLLKVLLAAIGAWCVTLGIIIGREYWRSLPLEGYRGYVEREFRSLMHRRRSRRASPGGTGR